MNLKSIYILVFIGMSTLAWGQKVEVKLYGERTNNIVRIAWVPKTWTANMEGVIIKRRTGSGLWQDVTPKLVVPASYVGKDLSNVEQQPAEQQRLNAKLEKMVADGKAKPMPEKEYLENILPSPERISAISFVFAIDYDLMLLNGFGCTDRDNITGKEYEYGLFPVIAGKPSADPAATYLSLATDTPDFNLDVNTEIEEIGNNTKLRLHWRFDLTDFRKKQIKGFNIYQEKKGGDKQILNKSIIWITSNNNPADLNYLVDFPQEDVDFYAVPVSYFVTEGQGFKLPFRPAAYKITIPPPKLAFAIDEEILALNWQLDHGYDTLINAYKVMKKSVGKEYKEEISLPADSRIYSVQMSGVTEQARYKIIAVTSTGREVWSNEVAIVYTPLNVVEPPVNLTGEIINKEGNNFIQLNWDYAQPVSGIEFRVFTKGPNGNLIWDSSFPKDIQPPFDIIIKSSLAREEHFAIQARTQDRRKSTLSNEIKVITPTRSLPPIFITGLELIGGEAKVEWKFSKEILDLTGFRIIVDDKVYKTEKEISRETRSYLLKGLAPGKHHINIVAVTQFGQEKQTNRKSIVLP